MNLSRIVRHLMFVAVLATSHVAFGDIIPDGTHSSNNGTATSHGFDRGSVVVLTLIALGILGTVFFRRVVVRSRV